MGRRQERRASRGANPMVDNQMWVDLCRTYAVERHCFERGSGQETLAGWVGMTTGRYHPPHHLRRVLRAAIQQGRARSLPRHMDGHSTCSRFEIMSTRLLEERT